MEVVNAIAKVRFSSTRPQRVRISESDELTVELLCFEPGQKLKIDAGLYCYYVVTGTATTSGNGGKVQLGTGQLVATAKDETHTLTNAGEQRLVCLAIGPASRKSRAR